eukprot:CAMPEP_0118920460 /NCGR_PEP_ID=MMETSP1166-20130328/19080_1 /TAXON_ID=1104430 /ORGANISM="Chrysoreinhardia sp, Strain CCMP3193" /LENGTH=217 /DNA_ID=CAMNT_0006860999 /DNA_START=440 /DNA_END=1094 /DNA_ORIENTATION=-
MTDRSTAELLTALLASGSYVCVFLLSSWTMPDGDLPDWWWRGYRAPELRHALVSLGTAKRHQYARFALWHVLSVAAVAHLLSRTLGCALGQEKVRLLPYSVACANVVSSALHAYLAVFTRSPYFDQLSHLASVAVVVKWRCAALTLLCLVFGVLVTIKLRLRRCAAILGGGTTTHQQPAADQRTNNDKKLDWAGGGGHSTVAIPSFFSRVIQHGGII